MSKSDALKIELEFAKVGFSTLLLSLVGIISYAFLNYEKTSGLVLIILGLGLVFIVVGILLVLIYTKKKLRELSDIKDKK